MYQQPANMVSHTPALTTRQAVPEALRANQQHEVSLVFLNRHFASLLQTFNVVATNPITVVCTSPGPLLAFNRPTVCTVTPQWPLQRGSLNFSIGIGGTGGGTQSVSSLAFKNSVPQSFVFTP